MHIYGLVPLGNVGYFLFSWIVQKFYLSICIYLFYSRLCRQSERVIWRKLLCINRLKKVRNATLFFSMHETISQHQDERDLYSLCVICWVSPAARGDVNRRCSAVYAMLCASSDCQTQLRGACLRLIRFIFLQSHLKSSARLELRARVAPSSRPDERRSGAADEC